MKRSMMDGACFVEDFGGSFRFAIAATASLRISVGGIRWDWPISSFGSSPATVAGGISQLVDRLQVCRLFVGLALVGVGRVSFDVLQKLRYAS